MAIIRINLFNRGTTPNGTAVAAFVLTLQTKVHRDFVPGNFVSASRLWWPTLFDHGDGRPVGEAFAAT